MKTLSVLPWGHWRQISHQSAPPSNCLFVITQILEDKGLSNLGTRLLTCNMASRFVTGLEDKGTNALFTGRLKIILSLNLRQNRKNALGKFPKTSN